MEDDSTYHSASKRLGVEDFDYDNAKLDVLENGGDPDYVTRRNAGKRDNYLKKIGLDPKDFKKK